MAVHALIEEAPQVCHGTNEWRTVAIAKAAHRLASGYHRVWETMDSSGRPQSIRHHIYPPSSGQVLRFLGNSIEEAVEWAIERHLSSVVELKVARFGPHPANADPLKFAAEANRHG
jgi:hypothetical protein